ncbi:unnamed protein product [Mytilus coruscus]|uniref:Uncharacterized protein n=1 Tax=Mytilus coruscus TaxID=42192 RepID=A0A6J8DBY6_MYTCO|nr:unnamed protein product [Mytilus coruscus]
MVRNRIISSEDSRASEFLVVSGKQFMKARNKRGLARLHCSIFWSKRADSIVWSEQGYQQVDSIVWSEQGYQQADNIFWSKQGYQQVNSIFWSRQGYQQVDSIVWSEQGYQQVDSIFLLEQKFHTSIIDNAEETIPKDLNDSQDKVLDNLHDEDDVTVASTPIKQSVVETKLTPKNRILQHSKTTETKFSEINSILSVIDQTMKSFVEKLAQLYSIQEKVPQIVQSVITNSLNTQKNEMMSQWKSIDDKVKHCNDTQLKQVISKQTDQSASIESLSSIVTSLQDRVEELENNRRTRNDNECPSIQNDISRVENTPISDTNNTSTKLSQVSKTKFDVLILGDSILRRIQPKRFTPEDQCTKTWNNSSIYVLPIISRKDIHDAIVNEANNTIELVCDLYPSIHTIERFEPSYDMFHDDVHLNYGKGLLAIVKHLKIALNIPYTNNTQQQRNRRQGENNFSRSTHQSYYRRDGLNMTNHNTNMNSHQGVNPLHGFNHHYPPSFNQQHMMPWFLPTNHSMNNPNFNNWRNPWSVPPFGQIHFPPPDQQQAQM